MRLPLSLSGQGKATKANRLLGDRPKAIVPFDRDLERVWIAKMVADLNKGFNLGLSSDLLLYRTAEDLCRARGDEERMAAVVSSLGRYVFGSEISYNKAPPRLPGLGC
jgi:hypothetical protein